MRVSPSTPLEPTLEQATRLAELGPSVLLLHQRIQTYLSAGGRLSWAATLRGGGRSGPDVLAAPALPLRVGQLLEVFHALRPQLPWCHVAPQATYDAVIRSAVRDPAAPGC